MELTVDKNTEIANKLNFRQSLSKIEDVMHEHPSAITGDDFEAKKPNKKYFCRWLLYKRNIYASRANNYY